MDGTCCGPSGADYVQDLCVETVDLADPQPGLWADPYLQVGPTTLYMPLEQAILTIFDATIGVSLSPDGSLLVGGTFDGTMDTRGVDCLLDFNCTEGATCDMLGTFVIPCESCPDGSGDYCLALSSFGAGGGQVLVTGIDPETGAVFGALTEITAAMLAGWTAGGFCP